MRSRPFGGLWGPLSRLGLAAGAAALVVDQAFKAVMLHGVRIAETGPVAVLPVLDLVMVWNYGISYGLFQQDGDLGRFVLLAIKLAAVVLLTIWLARAHSRMVAVALGLVIGGAIGNGIDRLVHGAVADFFRFHWGSFSWYVFNLADVAIVAGVLLLLYDSLRPARGPQ